MRIDDVRPSVTPATLLTRQTQSSRSTPRQDQLDTTPAARLLVLTQGAPNQALRPPQTSPVLRLHDGSVDDLMHALQHGNTSQRAHVAGSLSAMVGPHSELVAGLQHVLSPGTPHLAPLTGSQKSMVQDAITALSNRAPLSVADLSTIRSAVELGRERLASPSTLLGSDPVHGALGRANTAAANFGARLRGRRG